jgi:hypothetical protein
MTVFVFGFSHANVGCDASKDFRFCKLPILSRAFVAG